MTNDTGVSALLTRGLFRRYARPLVRKLCKRSRLPIISASLFLPCTTYGGEATVAVVDFDLLEQTLQGQMMPSTNRADVMRLERTVDQLKRQIDKSDLFKVVNTKATDRVIEQLKAQQLFLHDCNGCEIRVGKVSDADYVLVGWVQKVSNLILNLNIALRRVPNGEDVVSESVDLRGNTNEAWSRAATYILENGLIPEFRQAQASSAQAS